jgi:protein-tyrosine phosphatase
MAQFVFKQMVEERGLSEQFEIDSAATESYNEMCHAGIHYGTRDMLTAMHVSFEEHYSRCIRPRDYAYYDYILAMDDSNIEDIQSIVGEDSDNKIHRLLDFANKPRNIKDPWYTGNFDETYWDIVEGCDAFLNYLLKGDNNGKRN